MLILPLLSYIVFEVTVSSIRHENEISGINFRKVELQLSLLFIL